MSVDWSQRPPAPPRAMSVEPPAATTPALNLTSVYSTTAGKILAAVQADATESKDALIARLVKDVGSPSLPLGALRERSNGLKHKQLEELATRCGIANVSTATADALVASVRDVMVAAGIVCSDGWANRPLVHPPSDDDDVRIIEKLTPASSSPSDAVKAHAVAVIAPVLRWALKLKKDAVLPKIEKQDLYSQEMAIGLAKGAACDRATKIYVKDAIFDSLANPMFAIALNMSDHLVGKVVHIGAAGSAGVVNVLVSDVVSWNRTSDSDSTVIMIRGSTLPGEVSPVFPADEGQEQVVVLASAPASGQKTAVKQVLFRTDVFNIGSTVRVDSAGKVALAPVVGLGGDFHAAAKLLGFALEHQGGGGELACAPMGIVRLLLNSVANAPKRETKEVLAGARLLREASALFLMHPAVLFSLFLSIMRSDLCSSDGSVNRITDTQRAVAIEIIAILVDGGHVDRASYDEFMKPHVSIRSIDTSRVGYQAEFTLAAEAIMSYLSCVDSPIATTEPAKDAAVAVLKLKANFDAHVDSGTHAVDVMSMLLSAAGLLNVATVMPGTEFARVSFAPGYRTDLLTGLLMWQNPTSGAAHYEAVVSANHNAIELVPSSAQRSLHDLSKMWENKLKASKVKNVSSVPLPEDLRSPAALSAAAKLRTAKEAEAAKAKQAAGQASAPAGASKASEADSAGFETVGKTKKALTKEAKLAAAKKQEEADARAAAKREAAEEKNQAALDRDATEKSVREYVKEKFGRDQLLLARMQKKIAFALYSGSTPSIVRHALRTRSCVFGSVCRRRAGGLCVLAHKDVPPASAAPSVAPTQNAGLPQQINNSTRELVVRLENGANGTNVPSYADLVRPPSIEQENVRLRQMVQQQQQQLQQQLPLQPPLPPVAAASAGVRPEELARIVAAVVQAMTPSVTQAVLAAMPPPPPLLTR